MKKKKFVWFIFKLSCVKKSAKKMHLKKMNQTNEKNDDFSSFSIPALAFLIVLF